MTKFTLRIPDELNAKITAQAEANNRSRNQEIVEILSRPNFDFKIGRLEVREGEMLVVKANLHVQEAEDAYEFIKSRLPDIEVLMLRTDEAELTVVSRKEDRDEQK